MDDSSKAQQASFEAVFQQYLDVYMKGRNLKKLDEMVSENFSGFGTGMDENFYSKARGMEIFQRDIQSAPNELRHNIHRHEVKLMDQSNAIAVTELDLKTTISDQEIKLNNLRLLLLMHEEAGIIKITGMHISFPTEVHDEGESYPLKELEERYQVLKKMVDEKTKRQQEIIYQLQEAKDALREKTKFLQNIIDTISDLVSVTDMEGNFKFLGPSFIALGYNPDSLVGRNVMEFVHQDDYPETATAFAEFLANREDGRKVEYRYRRVDGDYLWFETVGKFILDDAGNPKEILFSSRDVTERKQAEEALRESEKKLRTTLDATPFPIAIVDLQDDKIFFWSRSAVELFGHTARTASEWYQMAYPDPDYRQVVIEEWKPVLEKARKSGQTVNTGERRITCKDGSECICEIYATFLPNNLIITFNDITERKKADIERKKLQEKLNQAQKLESVGRLAGGVAHDFNNMLGVILGHTELALLQADENHDLYNDLNEIQKAAKRSEDITKQLLAFARKQTISPRQLDLNDTVESMLNMLRRLIGENIDLAWIPAPHLWPVKMDPSQIDQILANLCVNARDAIAGVGKLTIETGRKSFDEEYCSEHPGFIPGDFVLLAVSDNGCGMYKETLDNLFEPFFTTKDVGKGTGLGLATIYGIVKQNNGFINVYSEPDQGSTFKIYLPRLGADEDTDKAVPEKKAAAGGDRNHPAGGR